jgi:hypothetical protein
MMFPSALRDVPSALTRSAGRGIIKNPNKKSPLESISGVFRIS